MLVSTGSNINLPINIFEGTLSIIIFKISETCMRNLVSGLVLHKIAPLKISRMANTLSISTLMIWIAASPDKKLWSIVPYEVNVCICTNIIPRCDMSCLILLLKGFYLFLNHSA